MAKEARRFKPGPEQTARIIEPDSKEWRELCIGERFEGMEFVEKMIRGGTASLVILPEPTQTCREKARLAGIGLESIVKTLCCMEAIENGGRMFLVTSTSGKRINLSDICGQHEELRYTELALSPVTLPGMAPGTCTPFVPSKVLNEIEFLIVQAPEWGLGERVVDVSIGGTDRISFCLSVSVRYKDLICSLESAYGEKMRLFYSEREDAPLPGRIEEQLRVMRGSPRHPKRYSPRLKAVKRLERLVEGSRLDDKERTLVISELRMVEDPTGIVSAEAARLASKLAQNS
jgi:hypothetical protein